MTFQGNTVRSNHVCEHSILKRGVFEGNTLRSSHLCEIDVEITLGCGPLSRSTSEGESRITSDGECRITA